MRLDDGFREPDGMTGSGDGVGPVLTLQSFTPAGSAAAALWAEVYRRAYLQAIEALRPTRYDRAMASSAN